MKTTWVAVFAALALTVSAIAGRQYLRLGDPEKSTPADYFDAVSEPDVPNFFVSDSSLLAPEGRQIQEVIRAEDGAPLENAPYFLLLQDGRFAFGYSDESGKTREIFAPQNTTYKLYLYDDAWAQWESHKPDAGSAAGAAGSGTDR